MDEEPPATAGTYVEITDGFMIGGDVFITPIPASLKGTIGIVLETGDQITESIGPGPSWGTYTREELKNPIDELEVEIITPGEWFGKKLDVDGLIWRKLSPLEVLAAQGDK